MRESVWGFVCTAIRNPEVFDQRLQLAIDYSQVTIKCHRVIGVGCTEANRHKSCRTLDENSSCGTRTTSVPLEKQWNQLRFGGEGRIV